MPRSRDLLVAAAVAAIALTFMALACAISAVTEVRRQAILPLNRGPRVVA